MGTMGESEAQKIRQNPNNVLNVSYFLVSYELLFVAHFLA